MRGKKNVIDMDPNARLGPQGVTELFPISSLGHTVVIPGLLGWTSLVQSPQFLPIFIWERASRSCFISGVTGGT